MRRTRESQKAHLMNELSSSNSNNQKKVIATRGSQSLVGDYKKTKNTNSHVSVLTLSGAWIVISVFLWFVFFASVLSLIAICGSGVILIALLKKFLIKDVEYQLINKVEQKQSLSETIDDNQHLFSDDIKEELKDIVHNINYLESFTEKNLLDIEQSHYVQSCKEKHLIDLFKSLESSHKDHLAENQKNVLEQFKAINNKLKRIISTVQQSIDLKIKVKSAFTKDNP